MPGLFGEEFDIKIKENNVKDLVKKVAKKELTQDEAAEKMLKSKKISLQERLAIIKENVIRVLGKQKSNVIVIKDRETFHNYVTEAIKIGRVAIDTETNNSLDAITCKLMGLCLYYPGGKQAYIPINHRNPETKERLAWQLTEEDCRIELQRILDNKTFRVFHNNKFDYKVIKCTCGVEVTADWDTLIASHLIDENEFSHGLKQLYIKFIDPTQEKYSIDHLFNNVEYADVDPEIFALYAATDSKMTDDLYLWQRPIMESEDYKRVRELFLEVEMPCVQVAAEMELEGVLFDKEYAERLRVKFEKMLAETDAKLSKELECCAQAINAWILSDEANAKARIYVPAKTKLTEEKILATYPLVEEETKRRYKLGKPRIEQLSDPIDLNSPTQLAILFYDILKYKAVDKDDPRGTGEEVLEKLKTPLTELLLDRRHTVKMLDAFITSLPEEVNPKTGKIHCNFNQYGAKTGRWSCSNPNLQQIPSHMKSMRMLFSADCINHIVDLNNDYYEVQKGDEVETSDGWKNVKELRIGDTVVGEENTDVIKNIVIKENSYLLYV